MAVRGLHRASVVARAAYHSDPPRAGIRLHGHAQGNHSARRHHVAHSRDEPLLQHAEWLATRRFENLESVNCENAPTPGSDAREFASGRHRVPERLATSSTPDPNVD